MQVCDEYPSDLSWLDWIAFIINDLNDEIFHADMQPFMFFTLGSNQHKLAGPVGVENRTAEYLLKDFTLKIVNFFSSTDN